MGVGKACDRVGGGGEQHAVPCLQARIAMPVARWVLLVPGVMATDCDAVQLVPVVDSRSLADVAREFESQAGGSWSGPILR